MLLLHTTEGQVAIDPATVDRIEASDFEPDAAAVTLDDGSEYHVPGADVMGLAAAVSEARGEHLCIYPAPGGTPPGD